VPNATYHVLGTPEDLMPDKMLEVPLPGISNMFTHQNIGTGLEPSITVILRNLTPGENYTVKIQEVLSTTAPRQLGDLVATKTVVDIVDGRAEIIFLDADIPRSAEGYGLYEVSLSGSDITSPVIWDYDAGVGDSISTDATGSPVISTRLAASVFATESFPAASSLVKAPTKSFLWESTSLPTNAYGSLRWESAPEPPASEGLIAGYLYYIRDSNKAIIDYGYSYTIDAQGALPYTSLVPKQSYTAEVYTVTDKYKISKTPLKLSFKTAAINPADVQIYGISQTSAALRFQENFGNDLSFDYKYYLQYTSVVDAKGKPDWNTATSEEVDSSIEDFKTQLKPGTQYFARVVTVGEGRHYGTSPDNVTEIVEDRVVATSKEIKFKTLDVPLAAISKPGFAMDGPNFGFKFNVMTPNATATAKLPLFSPSMSLPETKTEFMYEIIVADGSAKIDKATGMLIGGVSLSQEIGDLVIADSQQLDLVSGSTKFTPSVSPVVTIQDTQAALSELGLSLDSMKALQFQLKVTYMLVDAETGALVKPTDYGLQESAYYAESYTKAAKLTLPNWFV
jgi:hypothetical protein